jgi:hypothetical protein
MTIYTVLAPPAGAGSAGPDPDRFVFVKEGICWPALYMTAIWLLWRRMWLVFVLYLMVAAAIIAVADKMAAPVAWVIIVLFGFLVALEANNLRRWTLERSGYRFVGVASGDNRSEAEFRFFATWSAPTARQPQPEPPRPPSGAASHADEVVGLFPTPGGVS